MNLCQICRLYICGKYDKLYLLLKKLKKERFVMLKRLLLKRLCKGVLFYCVVIMPIRATGGHGGGDADWD